LTVSNGSAVERGADRLAAGVLQDGIAVGGDFATASAPAAASAGAIFNDHRLAEGTASLAPTSRATTSTAPPAA
jgi:hypothetical protein